MFIKCPVFFNVHYEEVSHDAGNGKQSQPCSNVVDENYDVKFAACSVYDNVESNAVSLD